MYTERNFKSKAELKRAVAAGERIAVFQYNDMFGKTAEVRANPYTTVFLEGPHYPQPHKWYAEAVVEYGVITKVK